MLTRITALTGVVLAGVLIALQLYTSQRVSAVEREIRRVKAEITLERSRIHHLRGAWSYVTSPDMLRPVVEAHTDMVAMTGAHLASLSDIPFHALPPTPTATPEALLRVTNDPSQSLQVIDALLLVESQ